MRRLALSVLTFFFLINITIAQTLEIDWGSFYELEKETFYQGVVGADDDGFFVLRSDRVGGCKNAKVWLEYISRAMYTVESSNEIIMPSVNGIETVFEKLFYIDGKLILFTSAVDNGRKQRLAYVQYLNKDGSLKNKPKEIGKMPPKNGGVDFSFELSPDKESILFYYYTFFESYNGEPFTFKVFDSNLKEVFNKKLVPPLKGKVFTIGQVKIGNSGNIYMSAKIKQESSKRSRTSTESYEFAVISYNKQRNDFFVQNVELKKNIVKDIAFGINKDENLVIGGFYGAKTSRDGSLGGVFYQVFNPSIQKIVSGPIDSKTLYKPFEREEAPNFKYKRFGDPKYFYNYKLKDVFCLENGAYTFLSEHQYTDKTEIKDPQTKEVSYVHYYYNNDIIAFGVNPKGVMSWIKRIPKNQYGIDDNRYMSGYKAVISKNKIKVLFNDHPSNLKNDNLEKVKQFKNNVKTSPKGLSMVVTIFNDGSLDTSVMFNNDDEKTVFVPAMLGETKDDAFIISGQKGKFVKFGSFYIQ